MSAASSAQPTRKACLGWVKTPLAYFDLAQILNYTEFVVLGVIVRHTFGWSRASAKLSMQTFLNATGGTHQGVYLAVAELVRKDLVRVVTGDRGEREYFPKLDDEIRTEHTAVGKCGQCREISIFDLAQHFAYVPHSYFTILPRCCEYSVHICVGVVLAASMRWDKSQQDFTAVETSLSVGEFEAMTGFSRGSVMAALKTAGEKKLIAEKQVSGRASLYSIQPEQFKHGMKELERRVPRTHGKPKMKPESGSETGQPAAEGDDAKKEEDSPKEEAHEVRQTIQSAEATGSSGLHPDAPPTRAKDFGRCRKCGAFGPIEPVKITAAARHEENDTADPPTSAAPDAPAAPKAEETVETQRHTPVLVLVKDDFAEFLNACDIAELRGSETDLSVARGLWATLGFEEKLEAVQGLKVRAAVGEFADPAYRPLPQNYLRNKIWQRPIRNRKSSKREELMADRNENLQMLQWMRSLKR